MNRYQFRRALLKQSLLVLGLSTWVFCSFIFATRPERPDVNALTQLVRLPASLPAHLEDHDGSAMAPIRMEVVRLGCWNKADPGAHMTDARWVRLTGGACSPAAAVTSLRNLSNGYTGTVFGDAGELTSDYIPLQKGKNTIVVGYQLGSGPISRNQFTFIRQ